MRHIVITGGSSGLGKCIVDALHDQHDVRCTDWSLETHVNVASLTSIQLHASKLRDLDHVKKVDVLINCAGINKLMPIETMDFAMWNDHMAVNARALLMTTKTLLPMLHGGTVLNVISNASHMPMTHSNAYNASKGAAAIMTRQMAHELGPSHGLTVFGISPNKLAGTAMSTSVEKQVRDLRGWTAAQEADHQRRKLAIGEETDPNTLAEFIAFLLSTKERHRYLHGCILEYGR